MVNIVQNGEYKNVKLGSMTPNEQIELVLTRDAYLGTGKYGDYTAITGTFNNEEVSILIGNSIKGSNYPTDKTSRLYLEAAELLEGQHIRITKKVKPVGKYMSTHYVLEVLNDMTDKTTKTTEQPTKEQTQTTTNKKTTIGLKIKPKVEDVFTQEEEDMIKQLTQVVKDYDDDVLVDSVIDSFKNAGKPISEDRAKALIVEAKKRV